LRSGQRIAQRSMQRSRKRSGLGSKGYTLLEIVLVINIIWIALLPVYPLVDKQYQSILLEQEARKFAAFLETQRQDAVLNSPQWSVAPVANPLVRIYNANIPHSYGVSQGTRTLERVYLPKSIKISTNITQKQFIYNRFGAPNKGGTVSLTNDRGQAKEIVIHLFTGVVEIKDY